MNLRELQAKYIAEKRRVTKEKLTIGALVRTTLSTDDGLNLTDGRKEKTGKSTLIFCGMTVMPIVALFLLFPWRNCCWANTLALSQKMTSE